MANGGSPVQAVSVAVRRGDTLLLVLRGRPPSLGLHAFPGGRVEPGETLEEAARRELREETALEAAETAAFRTIRVPDDDPAAPGFELTVFTASTLAGTPRAGDDAAAVGFYTLAEMSAMPVIASVLAIARELLPPAPGSPGKRLTSDKNPC